MRPFKGRNGGAQIFTWDEYVNQRPVISCSCGLCTCDVNSKMVDLQQSDCVLKFLVGLHESYAALRSQILLISPVPSLSKVYSLLLQEENQRSLSTHSAIEDPLAMFIRHKQNQENSFKPSYSNHNQISNPKFTKSKDKKRVKCTHCGFNGHTVDKCYQLIGYPPGWDGPMGKRAHPNTHSANVARIDTNEIPAVTTMVPTMNAELNQNRDILEKFLAFQAAQSTKTSSDPQHYAATAMCGPTHEEDDWFC